MFHGDLWYRKKVVWASPSFIPTSTSLDGVASQDVALLITYIDSQSKTKDQSPDYPTQEDILEYTIAMERSDQESVRRAFCF